MDDMNNNFNNQNGFQQDKNPQQNYPQGTYPQSMYQQDMYQQSFNNQVNNQELENKATMAMVFGIIGIFFAGIIFGILALVNASACKKAGYTNGKVTAGLVLGIIDLAALVLYIIIAFGAVGSAIMAAATGAL